MSEPLVFSPVCPVVEVILEPRESVLALKNEETPGSVECPARLPRTAPQGSLSVRRSLSLPRSGLPL